MKWPYLSLFYMIILLMTLIYAGYQHELVHKTIFETYGIKSEIKMFQYFPSIVTVSEPINSTQCPDDTCGMQHNMNEVVGYQLLPLYSIIGIGIAFLIFILEVYLINYNGDKK